MAVENNMVGPSFIATALKHKFILSALGAVAVIAVASGIYYAVETKRPSALPLPSAQNQLSATISAPGAVEPLENPDLSFAMSGRITYVGVKVGDRVSTGETLASLDVAALIAERSQAQANEKAQAAKLDQLKAGPRSTDIAVKQSAVSQAEQSRVNTYADVPAAISDAYAKSVTAVSDTDSLFSNPHTSAPTLIFNTANSDTAHAAVAGRITVGAELGAWSAEISTLSAASPQNELDAAIDKALAHLAIVRQYDDAVIAALNSAITTSTFTASSVSASQASASLDRSTVNGLITSLTDKKQTLVSEELAIEAATAALNQLNAGASPQDIAAQEAAVESAQANVAGINAQIANNIISAPFSGTVGSVSIKAGELGAPNVPAITLVPDSALQVVVYVTELDAPRIKKGDTASVTLDAYGSGRAFPAHVSEVDTAPSVVNQVSAYKVTLVFDTPDATIKTGMTANATITPSAQ